MVIQQSLEDIALPPQPSDVAVRQADEASLFLLWEQGQWWSDVAGLDHGDVVKEARKIAVLSKLRLIDRERRGLR
jgi:hypothetical protein